MVAQGDLAPSLTTVRPSLVALCVLLCAHCQREAPTSPATPRASVLVWTSASVPPSSAPESPPVASASAAPSASSSASASPVASVSASASAPVDPLNRAEPPLQSEDLTSQARHLFEAIQADDPGKADDFFFPRAPFIPLKDVGNPGHYWDYLHRAYVKDIHDLHQRHQQTLKDGEFLSFELGSTPGWVKPGEEANKIGYFRTFTSHLRYRAAGALHSIDVKVIISWDHRWYITHLLPWKK